MMKKRVTIEYRFDSPLSGYAAGEVRLTADTAGGYTLCWADDEKFLDGWFAVASMHLKAGDSGVFRFGERVAIPVGATRLITLCDGAKVAACPIPTEKRLPYSETDRCCRFGALADVHIDLENGGRNIYFVNAESNFKCALKVCKHHDADFIVIAGDMITNATGSDAEWQRYRRIIADSGYTKPIYEAIGNHETRFASYGNCTLESEIGSFITNTGLDEAPATIASGKPYFEITEPRTGDHFLFMALEAGYNPAAADNFSDAQMEWVEGLIADYSGDGHRIFLIQHAPIMGYGAGDDPRHPAYSGSLHADERFRNNLRFKRLIEAHREIIWLSGHTHVDLRDNVNFSDESGASCRMFHIPAVAGTTRLAYDAAGKRRLDRTFYDDATQGYLVDLYPDAAILCGVNFFHNKRYPAYTSIV